MRIQGGIQDVEEESVWIFEMCQREAEYWVLRSERVEEFGIGDGRMWYGDMDRWVLRLFIALGSFLNGERFGAIVGVCRECVFEERAFKNWRWSWSNIIWFVANCVSRYYVELLPRTPYELRRQLKARRDFSPPRDNLIPKFVTN